MISLTRNPMPYAIFRMSKCLILCVTSKILFTSDELNTLGSVFVALGLITALKISDLE